jgi:hypothetical protein
MLMWIADLRVEAAPTRLFRCDCANELCEYHSADWPLLLGVVLEAFRGRCGHGLVSLDEARDAVLPSIAARLPRRRHPLEYWFALSMFDDPMHATPTQWTNGQHRCQAAMDAGCNYVLFAG